MESGGRARYLTRRGRAAAWKITYSALVLSRNIKGRFASNRSTNFKLATTGPAPPLARLRPPPKQAVARLLIWKARPCTPVIQLPGV
jgi:hypothetical protein